MEIFFFFLLFLGDVRTKGKVLFAPPYHLSVETAVLF